MTPHALAQSIVDKFKMDTKDSDYTVIEGDDADQLVLDITAALETREQAIVDDPGCSMAGRIDLGHGKDGRCDIRKAPCPARCRQQEIVHLQAEINSMNLIEIPNTRREAWEEATKAIEALMGKDSGNWNRAIAYAADVCRRQGAAPLEPPQ